MSFPYKNPITGQQTDGPISISRNAVQGTNFSVLGVGGYMELYNLTDLNLTLVIKYTVFYTYLLFPAPCYC